MTETTKTTYKTAPHFDGDRRSYATWLKKLTMWIALTDVDKDKQALVIVQALSGVAEDIAINLDIDALREADLVDASDVGIHGTRVPKGVKFLIEALNRGGFQVSGVELSFQALDEWIDFRRAPGTSMSKYTVDFENRYRACKQHKIVVPEVNHPGAEQEGPGHSPQALRAPKC